MKTIKLLVLVLLSTLFLSCSENYSNDDFLEEIVKEDVLVSKTYHFKQYYEKPVTINRSTNGNHIDGYRYDSSGKRIILGSVIFQGRYTNNEVIDRLTIDLTSFSAGIKELILGYSPSNPNQIQSKYATINYLNIIGLDKHPDLKITGTGVFDKVQVINSNVSINKLNSISRNMFEQIDYERKEWEWTLREGSSNQMYSNLQDKPVGYIGYAEGDRRGIKIEIMNITENYN